jgi:hypothetical protein
MEKFKKMTGINTSLWVKDFGVVAVLLKTQHQDVQSIVREIFDALDYYFTDTDDPVFVNNSLQDIVWLEDIKRVVRTS